MADGTGVDEGGELSSSDWSSSRAGVKHFDDWAGLAALAFCLRGHGLLSCDVDDPRRRGEIITFCYRCGGYCTDFRPNDVLLDVCKGRPALAQIASQIKRIRDGKHPHGRATTKDLRLGNPRGPGQPERDLLAVRGGRPTAPSAASAPDVGPAQARGYASKSDVLRAFGLLESELPQVKALGEAERRAPEESEDDEASDSEGGLF